MVRVVRHAPTAQAAADALVRLASDLSKERRGRLLEVAASWQHHSSASPSLLGRSRTALASTSGCSTVEA